MTNLKKLALGAVVASGVAMGLAAPADAGVVIGIGVGGPAHGWCYYHPYRCGGRTVAVRAVAVRPVVGVWRYHGWHHGWYHGYHRWH